MVGPKGTSLYVHVPFCRSRCRYCDFYSCVIEGPEESGLWLSALEKSLERVADLAPFPTIYVGGGTPSVLPQEDFARLLKLLEPHLATGGEWTLEANPESLDQEKCRSMMGVGVTRLSLGIQSLRSQDRKFLSRIHDADGAMEALDLAVAYGPPGLSADLLLGLPEQSHEDIAFQVQKLVDAGVEHLSYYLLTVEDGTPLAAAVEKGEVVLPDAEVQAEQLRFCRKLVTTVGLPPYEISNAAMPGKECRHNLRYWLGGDYVGLGPSASSLLQGVRSRNTPDLKRWASAVNQGEDARESEERLDPDQAAGERAWLMLRTSEGVDLNEVQALTGCGEEWVSQAGKTLLIFEQTDLIEVVEGRFCLTEKGILQGDGIGAAFLSPDTEP